MPAYVYRPPSYIPYKPHYRLADIVPAATATLAPAAFSMSAQAVAAQAGATLAPAAFTLAAFNTWRTSAGLAPAAFHLASGTTIVNPNFSGWLQGRRVRLRYLH